MEPTPQEQALLREAAEDSLRAIADDGNRVSPRLKPLLRYLEGHLFDSELRVASWFRACGRGSQDRARFREELQVSPKSYLTRHRVDTAKRLLKESDLGIWAVGELLGYPSQRTFDKTFEREIRCTPSAFRKKFRKDQRKGPGRHNEELATIVPWRRVLALAGPPGAEEELMRKLENDYPFLRKDPCGADPGRRLREERQAEKVWEKLKDRRFTEQKLLLHHQVGFRTTALFDLLRRKSIEESRKNRQRGIEVAELALQSLDTCSDALGEDLANRRAQGWVYLANAYCLASDFHAAEEGFSRARFEWSCAGSHRDPLVDAELRRKTAMLRWYQRRYEEALDLVDSAIVVFRGADEPVALARSHILKACIVRDAGNYELGISELKNGLNLINENDEPFLCLSAQSGLALAYGLAGNGEQAVRWLLKSDDLCRTLKNDVATYQLKWTAGLVEYLQGRLYVAAQRLAEARDGLAALGEIGYTSVVTLDLAMLYSEEGRAQEAMELAGQVLPMLQALNFRGEVLAAVQVFGEAVEGEKLPFSVLQQVRHLVSGNHPVIGV